MKLYGGYDGKRVEKKKKKFQLWKQKGGKRLSQKPDDNPSFQPIEFLLGKIKYLSERLKEYFGVVDYEEMDEEFYHLPKMSDTVDAIGLEEEKIELREMLENFISDSNSDIKIATLNVDSLENLEDVVYYVEEGYIVFVNYGILPFSARNEFDKQLSIELMQLGTHLTHISKSEIICAGRQVMIEDATSEKKDAKIYDLRSVIKR